MNNLAQMVVPINDTQFGDESVKTINARELHKFLDVGRRFASWMQGRIKEYGFVENKDYVLCFPNRGSNRGGTNRVEYHITLDMAKELAMVEKTDKGREVRRYFIECEKVMRQINDSLIMQFNRAVLEFEKFSELASNAGRTLCIVGKQHKPQAKAKISSLKDKIQPNLFILPSGDDEEGGNKGGVPA